MRRCIWIVLLGLGCQNVCGDGISQRQEECDDGNEVAEDGCSPLCQQEVCGDGTTQALLGEQCDDGNLIPGDGCNELCEQEASLQFTYVIFDAFSDRAFKTCAEQGVSEITISLGDFDTGFIFLEQRVPCEYDGDSNGSGFIEQEELATIRVEFVARSFGLVIGLLDANGVAIPIGDHPFQINFIHPGPVPTYIFPVALFPGENEITFNNPSNESPAVDDSLQFVICGNDPCGF